MCGDIYRTHFSTIQDRKDEKRKQKNGKMCFLINLMILTFSVMDLDSCQENMCIRKKRVLLVHFASVFRVEKNVLFADARWILALDSGRSAEDRTSVSGIFVLFNYKH